MHPSTIARTVPHPAVARGAYHLGVRRRHKEGTATPNQADQKRMHARDAMPSLGRLPVVDDALGQRGPDALRERAWDRDLTGACGGVRLVVFRGSGLSGTSFAFRAGARRGNCRKQGECGQSL